MKSTKKKSPKLHTCEKCGKKYDPIEVSIMYGEDSSILLFGYCSEKCYTKSQIE